MNKRPEKRGTRFAGQVIILCLGVGVLASAVHAQAGSGEGVPGDFNGDGRVDVADLGVLSSNWRRRMAWGPWERFPPRLVAHYRLDGDATDSGGENDGTVYGSPTWVSGQNAAVGSGAVALEGGDYISAADDPVFDFGGSVTISAWLRTGNGAGTATVIGKGDAWRLAVEADGRLRLAFGGLSAGGEMRGVRNVADNKWHQVAAVYDRDREQSTLYVDGQIDSAGFASGWIAANDCEIRIGGDSSSGADWWNGSIDDVRIYNCALTVQQIFSRITWHVDAANGRDTFSGQGKGRAFRTIQHAIDMAADGDEIVVWPGVYSEAIFFMGKAITVRSIADAAVIEAPGDYAVNFYWGEQEDSILQNFVIANSTIGIFVENMSRPTIRNVTVVNNEYGLQAYLGSRPVVSNSIFWGNLHSDIFNDSYAPQVSFSCIQRGAAGEGNISADPLFAGAGDWHLSSEKGRFVASGEPSNSGAGGGYWVLDLQTSPCVDGGDPALNPMGESMPNGARVNMGAYGGTPQASKSPWPLRCDSNYDGAVDLDDLMVLVENWLLH